MRWLGKMRAMPSRSRAAGFGSALVLAGLLAAGGCAHQHTGSAGTGGTVHHVVLIWLKDSGSEAGRWRVIRASRGLARIPGVLSVEAGEVLESRRAIVDDSFDVAIHMRFASVAAMKAYLGHPLHVATVRDQIRPLTRRITVYDFRE